MPIDPRLLEQLAMGGMNPNPTGFNPEMLRAQMPMPNPNMGGGLGGLYRRAGIGMQNGIGRFSNALFPMNPTVASRMSAEQMKGMQSQALMNFGLGTLGAASQPGAKLGSSLAEGYFGAQKDMMGQQQMAYQLGAQEREENREVEGIGTEESRYQTGLGRQQRLDQQALGQQNLDNDFRERQLKEMSKYRMGMLGSRGGADGAITPDARRMLAIQTLKSPTLMNAYLSRSGRYNAAERTALINEQSTVLKELNIKPEQLASLQANVKAQAGAIMQNQKAVSSLQAFEAVVQNNGMRLKELFAKVSDTGIPLANALTRGAEYGLGSADMAELKQVLQNFATETARIVAGHPQLLGQVTDTARAEIEDVVSGNMTVAQANRVIDRLMFESQVREQGFQEAIRSSAASMDAFGSPGQAFPPQGGLGQFQTAPMQGGQPMTVQPQSDRVVNWDDL